MEKKSCSHCGGKGIVKVSVIDMMIDAQYDGRRRRRVYRSMKCRECGGTGRVEIENAAESLVEDAARRVLRIL